MEHHRGEDENKCSFEVDLSCDLGSKIIAGLFLLFSIGAIAYIWRLAIWG